MNCIIGNVIRSLREKNNLTQKELAEKLSISEKTISKWETNKGLPDIGILEELALHLGVSLSELLTGTIYENKNKAGNMARGSFYICPVCGNIIYAIGSGDYNCCGISLPKQDAEEIDEEHNINVSILENEYYITMDHPMTKNHYISFVALVTMDNVQIHKLYPEQDVELRLQRRGHGTLYFYCNRHGLYKHKIKIR